MALSVGTRLGPYEILTAIGAGGMGEVYKARDTRLDRIVAIKISKTEFSERFAREARAVATLNHQNVCQLYDLGTLAEGGGYLVMEYIDGSPIVPVDSVRKLLDLAAQIADGLAAAHSAGFTHRDLKPDNVLVTGPQTTNPGRVKILDFGLAKFAGSSAPSEATKTIAAVTNPGTVMGTLSYMSPEQARGLEVDARSDQFSFGLIVYELAAGKRAFVRPSAAETMAAIIREEAEPLPPSVPAPLRWVVDRCLAKDPAERYDSTRDLYRELRQIRDRLSETSSAVAAATAPSAPKLKRRLALSAGAIGCLVTGAALTRFLGPPPATGPDLSAYRFTAIAHDAAEERAPKWSPDGKSIVYTARVHGIMQVFTKVVGSPDAAQLTKTEEDCTLPFWSPDGATIYYVSRRSLQSVPASAGTPQSVLEGVDSAALHPDGATLAFERLGKIWLGSLKGAEVKEFWSGPANRGLSFSPDGSKVVVNAIGGIWLLPYPSGPPRKLAVKEVPVGAPSWFPDSRHLAVALRSDDGDVNTLSILDTTDGTRRTVASDANGFSTPSVSPGGSRIAYSAGQFGWDALEISIPKGEVRTLISGGVSLWPDWAPSGTHFIFSIPTGAGAGIEDRQAAGDGFSRHLLEAGGANEPQWAPDGSRFAFYSDFKATSKLQIANASGGSSIALDSTKAGVIRGMSWSPDGQWIAYWRRISRNPELVKIRATPGAVPEILVNAKTQPWQTSTVRWSPAGDWIAYPAADGIDLISPDGKSGRKLTTRKFLAYNFSKDGGQLYGIFQDTTGQVVQGNAAQWLLYSVNVNSGAEQLLAPIDLPASVSSLAGLSIHPDGKRFLTSIAKWPFDIWMLEGFEEPRAQSWIARLLHP